MKRETIIFIFLSLAVLYASLYTPEAERQLQASVIPDDAIRLRILANSNSDADQEVKRLIRDKVHAEISSWIQDFHSVDQAREEIKRHLPDLRKLVKRELQQAGMPMPFSVQLGSFAFPTKLYGNIVYPAGEYETLLITIGDGLGANWWCVLFPPLCFLDFDSGETVNDEEEQNEEQFEKADEHAGKADEEDEKIEFSFFIVKWINKLWTKVKNAL